LQFDFDLISYKVQGVVGKSLETFRTSSQFFLFVGIWDAAVFLFKETWTIESWF